MTTIYTIGHTKKSLEQFISALKLAEVDAVIDIRLRNTSQLVGFAKKKDLAFLLRVGFGIQYEHILDLAPTAEILDAYKDNGDWDAYREAFLPLLAARHAEAIGRALVDRFHRPCLLCAEPTADRCHRCLVADWWAEQIPDSTVIHL